MQIRHIAIRNFRGISSMDWSIQSSVVCLIGSGDSTKSTILDAIEYTLSPRWNLSFDDSDFYKTNINTPIEITITIGDLPVYFISQQKYGLLLRGWSSSDGLHDEPGNDDEVVLSIKLKVDKSLEAEWFIINDREPEGKRLSSKDREAFGITRLGTQIDKHLSWRRGSMLLSLTRDATGASSVVMDANRTARNTTSLDNVEDLQNAINQITEEAALLGVKSKDKYVAAIDPQAMSTGTGVIALHDGSVPLRLAGLGTRRLVTMGAQMHSVETGGILLIDEIEQGLEPYRLRNLLRQLQSRVTAASVPMGQVFITSHSSVTVVELEAHYHHIVRSTSGVTKVLQVPTSLQAIVRAAPEALLCRRVIVCEGKTEYGILCGMDAYWQTSLHRYGFAYEGVSLVEGVGGCAPKRALDLSKLGYPTCLFVDGDKLAELSPSVTELRNAGITVIHWSDGKCTEGRLTADLPWKALQQIVDMAITEHGKEKIISQIAEQLNRKQNELSATLDHIKTLGDSESCIRLAVGRAAHKGSWFKNIDLGKSLAMKVGEHWGECNTSDLIIRLQELSTWVYGN